MSLDVYLELEQSTATVYSEVNRLIGGTGIFIREDGQTKEITRSEWDERFPGKEPVVAMACPEPGEVYSANITHNLNRMAEAARIYGIVWRPEENGIEIADQLIKPLKEGIDLLKSDPDRFKQYDASNGWGTYDDFVPWLERYLKACQDYPTARVSASR